MVSKKKAHHLKRLSPYVQLMRNVKTDAERRRIIKSCPNYILDDMVEVLYNILHKNVTIRNKKFLMAMNKYRSPLVKLFNLYSKKGKRRVLVRNQSGGFLGAIIPVIASVLAAATTRIL